MAFFIWKGFSRLINNFSSSVFCFFRLFYFVRLDQRSKCLEAMWKAHLGVLLLAMLLVWFNIEETVADEMMKSLPSTRSIGSIGWTKSTTPVNEPLTFVTTLTPEADETLTTSPIPDIEQFKERHQSTPPYQLLFSNASQTLPLTADDKKVKLQLFVNDTLQPVSFYK